ncbi:DUF2461 domain-containing protein [Cryobacterium psychrophilum]|uniref:DUF2461 domain-containing protein n=1 Tax=Cryobacterium psychrophilum TaxID=41988 RepID=A0A4Y8KIY3_9MICO|nr:DUF2461 domain-containing protein [Cryobacterium psychrophilum]TDW30869.1 uncharacterized protein (TIGR02453 family) [Cryobacterium psychrophilum]TFD75743.1 DUF2461 domain-containing protein [Cryobacterium psychrophilum]
MVTNPNVHFSASALDFLDELEHHNDREWFAENKPTYERELKSRMLEVAEAVNDTLAEFAPDHLRAPSKAMLRIYRDVRFAKDKSPYKTHVAAHWPRQGVEGSAGFFLQVGARSLMIAGGAWGPRPDQLAAIRRHILDHEQAVRGLLGDPHLTRLFEPMDGDALVRAPRGFSADHPALDLLRNRRWAFTAHLPGEAAESPDFIETIVERFRAVAPLVEFLNTPLTTLEVTRSLTKGRA